MPKSIPQDLVNFSLLCYPGSEHVLRVSDLYLKINWRGLYAFIFWLVICKFKQLVLLFNIFNCLNCKVFLKVAAKYERLQKINQGRKTATISEFYRAHVQDL